MPSENNKLCPFRGAERNICDENFQLRDDICRSIDCKC